MFVEEVNKVEFTTRPNPLKEGPVNFYTRIIFLNRKEFQRIISGIAKYGRRVWAVSSRGKYLRIVIILTNEQLHLMMLIVNNHIKNKYLFVVLLKRRSNKIKRERVVNSWTCCEN